MYHSVGRNNAFFTVSPESFEGQMSYLAANHYRVVSVSELLGILENRKKTPAKTVVITFDDGYQDNYHNVFPALKKYAFPAAIFLVTDSVGGDRTTSQGVTLPMLNWGQIEEMAHSGLVEFFPHSHTHPRLDSLSRKDLEQEVRASKNILEKRLGKAVRVFAYPFGRSGREVIDVLKREGFRAAFSIKTGRVSSKSDPFLLERNSVDSKVTHLMFGWIVHFGRF